MFVSNFLQGELAHRLVKRLYGLTNKQDAPGQIARHYRRAHHFDTAPDRHAPRHDNTDDSPAFHHKISNSRNDSIELASFSSANTQDPAAKVDPCTPSYCSSPYLASRTLSINSASTSSAGSLEKVSMVTTPACLRMKNGTRFGSSTIRYFQSNNFLSTTLHTMSAATAIQSIPPPILTLCSGLLKPALTPTHTGMRKFSGFTMPVSQQPIRQP